MRRWQAPLATIVNVALALGCSSSDSTGGPSGPTPTITITTPNDGDTVGISPEVEGTDISLPTVVEFTVTNFTLAEPGKCAGASGCGHVHVKVDGDACDDVDAMTGNRLPYNEDIWQSPGDADFLYCPGVTITPTAVDGADGPHTIALVLADDSHAPITGPDGNAIQSQVGVTVHASAAGGGGAGGTAGAGGAGGAGGTGGI